MVVEWLVWVSEGLVSGVVANADDSGVGAEVCVTSQLTWY